MRDEKRAQNAPETVDKDTNNFADEQVKTHSFQVGEIVRVKSDGAELPIDKIEFDEIAGKFLYKVGDLWENEDGIEPMDDKPLDDEAPESNEPQFDFSSIDNPVAPPEDVKELPTWGLPEDLQNVVEEIANGYQCNRDFVVASMMVATSTMLGKRVTSRFGNHTNYSSLWIAIVGGTSSGKTAPLSFLFEPIEQMESDAYRAYQEEFRQWEKTDGEDRGKKPEYRHNLINNPTDESVLHELSVNGSITWKIDELRTMFDGFGKYSKNGGGTIVGNLLSIFNNVDVNITRATSEPKYIAKPNLNIIGGIQPSVLKRVMNFGGFVDDGLFQRFLYVFPEQSNIPMFTDVIISEHVQETWDRTVDRLAHMGDVTLHETHTAKKMHIETINRWRGECARYVEQDIDAIVSLLRKLEIHLCRWSMVTAILSGKNQIDRDTMRYSVECMEYFKRCGEKAYSLIVNDEVMPQEPKRPEVFKQLQKWYGDTLNQTKLADALGMSQQAISKFLRAN